MMKSKEGESQVPFLTWCAARQRHGYNDYVATKACWWQWYTQDYKYRMQLLVPDSPVMKTCAHKLTSAIYCIAWSFFLLQRAKTCNSPKYRVTEQAVCTWVTFKLTYWYIHDVCSVASRAKEYQVLPLLTFHCCRAGGEPGNEASLLPQRKQ